MEQLNRITQQPNVMGGKACIRGMRVTVGMVVGQIGSGRSVDEILADYPYLEREDIMQALRYAAWRARRARGHAGQRMKLLVDMNLSPRWVALLADTGIEAAHWSTLGAKNAPDSEIMAYANAHDYVCCHCNREADKPC
ncbi:MAG: DUF5615 family PIN-like protein [Sulfuricella sp.]